MDDQHFWPDLRRLLEVLIPISDCIAVVECASGTVCDAMRHFMGLGKAIYEADSSDTFQLASQEAFFRYFSKDKLKQEYVLLLAAFLMDRRNNAN